MMKRSNALQRLLRQAGRISRDSFLMVILAVGICFLPLLSSTMDDFRIILNYDLPLL